VDISLDLIHELFWRPRMSFKKVKNIKSVNFRLEIIIKLNDMSVNKNHFITHRRNSKILHNLTFFCPFNHLLKYLEIFYYFYGYAWAKKFCNFTFDVEKSYLKKKRKYSSTTNKFIFKFILHLVNSHFQGWI